MSGARRAVAAHRRRRSQNGFIRVEVQVRAPDASLIRRAAKILRDETSEAGLVRGVLASAPEPLTGYDLMKAITGGVPIDIPDGPFERRRDPRFDYARDIDL